MFCGGYVQVVIFLLILKPAEGSHHSLVADGMVSYQHNQAADAMDSYQHNQAADAMDSYQHNQAADAMDSYQHNQAADAMDSYQHNQAADGMDSYQHNQAADVALLMDTLVTSYTPNCLRVFISTKDDREVLNSSVTMGVHSISDDSSLYFTKMIMMGGDNDNLIGAKSSIYLTNTPITFSQVKKALLHINSNINQMSSFACVSYLLSGPPDSRLLPVLTDPTSSTRLARYFLVHTQNSTEAEQFLLDQRLGKEENVAALVQEESQNKSYWRVLIRQLLHPSGSPQVLTVNRWSRDTGLTSTENIFPEQMANFYKKRLIAITLPYIPFIAFQTTKESLNINLKPCIDKFLLDAIANTLNFTYEAVVPADGQWGYPNEKGVFVGMVREVEVARAHFTLALTVTQERMQVIEYTYSYYRDGITFITAKGRSSPPWRKVLTPFRTSVWICVLVSVGGGSLLYHIIYHAQATLTSSRLLSSHAFMHVLASFLSQSLRSYLSLQAGKVFLGFWFLYAFLVTSYYKTSLTSTLAVPFVPSNIDTLQDLMQSGLLYGITPSKGSIYTMFAQNKIPLYRKMFTDMQYYKTPESIRRVAEGQYAFIYWKSYLDPLVVRHNNDPQRTTDIRTAQETFFPGRFAWGVPKGVPYERTMSLVMKRCVQGGLIDKWMKDSLAIFLKEWQKEDNPEGKFTMGTGKKLREVVFSLDHLQGPFLMLLLGYGGGGLILALEILATTLWKTG